jgi:ribosomal protein S21
LSEVYLREGETQDSLLHRFQKMIQTSGILREAKDHRFFMSKREVYRIKARRTARRKRQQQRYRVEGRSNSRKGA